MRYCQPALPTVQRASTESIPRCHHHLQVDLNQIAGPLVLLLVSTLVSARLLPVDDPVVTPHTEQLQSGIFARVHPLHVVHQPLGPSVRDPPL